MNTLIEKFYKLLNDETAKQFETYFNMLAEWNEKFNLTAITERKEVYVKHFADSIAAFDFIKEGTVIDIGAGAGFPSIPLKILNDKLDMTMADSLNKRITFLQAVIDKLKLTKIKAVHTRAEDLNKAELYDFAVSRAVAPLRTLAELSMPFVKNQGYMAAYKAALVEEEVESSTKAISTLGGGKIEIIKMKLDDETTRSLILIKKIRDTPKIYPRGGNKSKTDPL